MEQVLSGHWFEFAEVVGIIGGLLFSAHTSWREERTRKISNLIAINEQYNRLGQEMQEQPELFRILKKDVNLKDAPMSDAELHYVKRQIVHMSTVYWAMKMGMFVKLEGMREDIGEFMSLPIPKAVWEKFKRFQDEDFATFVESAMK